MSIWLAFLFNGNDGKVKYGFLYLSLGMEEYLCKDEVVIFDREKDAVLINEDGIDMIFKNKVAAKNFLFSLSYKPEFIESNFLFVPVNYPVNLN